MPLEAPVTTAHGAESGAMGIDYPARPRRRLEAARPCTVGRARSYPPSPGPIAPGTCEMSACGVAADMSRGEAGDRADGGDSPLVDGTAAAQILFVTIEDDSVRCDVIVLEDGVWGGQFLVAGTPL